MAKFDAPNVDRPCHDCEERLGSLGNYAVDHVAPML
jgi:hypothetical protein